MSFSNKFENGIVILGAGNVATHLSLALKKANFNIKCIFSKTIESAKKLATKVDAQNTNDIEHIPVDADLYIIAVKDDAITSIVNNLDLKYSIVVHTAGSVPMDVFEDKFNHYGVFYPLQTFSKTRDLDFSTIPICIEANSKQLEDILMQIAQQLTTTVELIDSEQRKVLHLAAVFACNFSNHMYAAASEILNSSGITFDLLKPLITETVQKAVDNSPEQAQTGPAVRNDKEVISKHLEMLKDKPQLQNIYRFVSESIYQLKKRKTIK